jgi:hypothetical protein
MRRNIGAVLDRRDVHGQARTSGSLLLRCGSERIDRGGLRARVGHRGRRCRHLGRRRAIRRRREHRGQLKAGPHAGPPRVPQIASRGCGCLRCSEVATEGFADQLRRGGSLGLGPLE